MTGLSDDVDRVKGESTIKDDSLGFEQRGEGECRLLR